MRERYETTFGIYNHDQPPSDRPLATIAMQWAEDASGGSTLYERIQQFKTHGVFKHFGLSITEFLELPTDVVLFILEQSAKAQREEGGIASKLLDDLGGR